MTPSDTNPINGLSAGIHLEASSTPLEHMAVALSYRLPDGIWGGTGLQAFSPFFGWQRTPRDKIDSSGNVQKDSVWPPVFGINLNIDRAIEWLK